MLIWTAYNSSEHVLDTKMYQNIIILNVLFSVPISNMELCSFMGLLCVVCFTGAAQWVDFFHWIVYLSQRSLCWPTITSSGLINEIWIFFILTYVTVYLFTVNCTCHFEVNSSHLARCLTNHFLFYHLKQFGFISEAALLLNCW